MSSVGHEHNVIVGTEIFNVNMVASLQLQVWTDVHGHAEVVELDLELGHLRQGREFCRQRYQ